MPYGECPVCGQRYHLSVRDPEWHQKQGLEVGDILKEKCFPCWKELKEYDVVKVISLPAGVGRVEVGDIGTVLMIHEKGKEDEAFEVESVLPDGTNRWLGTFLREHLQYDLSKNKIR